jgi:hypothetical protein
MARENYLVQPDYVAERKADYKAGERINKKWTPISSKDAFKKRPEGTNGNVSSHIVVVKKTKKIKFNEGFYSEKVGEVSLSSAISSAFALYRTICMINNPIVETEGAVGYKVPWSIKLVHNETGEIFGISEWKGAFGVWTRFTSVKELPESFKKDITEFLNLMFSDKSPHPYDDCTAGGVA